MCEPVTLGGFSTSLWNIASTAISIGAGLYSQAQQSAQQTAQHNAMVEYQNKAQLDAYNANVAAINTQQAQVNAQSQQEKSEIARQAMAERSRLRTISGEFGSNGNVLQRLNSSIGINASENIDLLEQNRINQIGSSGLQQSAMRQNTWNSLQTKKKNPGIGWDGALLTIAGGLASGIGGVSKQKKPTDATDIPELLTKQGFEPSDFRRL